MTRENILHRSQPILRNHDLVLFDVIPIVDIIPISPISSSCQRKMIIKYVFYILECE
jgi:hypothetical protein